MKPSFVKDPSAKLNYTIDWSAWLGETETISTSTWTAEDGITIASSSNDTTSTTVWLTGGTAGETYWVTNHITVSDGRIDERTISITVADR